jgi:hypothetical protein
MMNHAAGESITVRDVQDEGQDSATVGDAGSLASVKLGSKGIRAAQGPETPAEFGTFAHEAYGYAAEDKYGDRADVERRVGVTKPDGRMAEGEVDLTVGNALIDYKSCDMRDWTASEASAAAREHGQQMKEYVESPDTPANAKGWIIATVPPNSQEVRDAYSGRLKEYGVGVEFAKGEDQASVMRATDAAVERTPQQDE